MRIVIIEDEQAAARSLERKVEKLGYKICKKLSSVEESVFWFKNQEVPDLIFLDIQLSDGLSFEIFEQVTLKSAIIFTTAYDEYALKAFKLNSIDYLLKPIQEDELQNAISKFLNHRNAFFEFSENFDLFKKFVNNDEKTPQFKERFTVKIGNQMKIVPLGEIVAFYSENKATYLKTISNRDYLIDGSLDQVMLVLNPNVFFRINRKHLLAITAIKEIHHYSQSRLKIILQGDCSINELWLVSRERVGDFKSWIGY